MTNSFENFRIFILSGISLHIADCTPGKIHLPRLKKINAKKSEKFFKFQKEFGKSYNNSL
ncbi:MAG: hypothetical protein DBY30_08260 [Verrucomicrobia bacterium]|nr:MAG: hypothetical protein DBY30_08260 [Verrucomicrobiota bacterium]